MEGKRPFQQEEKVMLECAEAITYPDERVSDELITRLREFFDEDGIVELAGLVAFQNFSSKFNNALDIPFQGLCRLPSLSPQVD